MTTQRRLIEAIESAHPVTVWVVEEHLSKYLKGDPNALTPADWATLKAAVDNKDFRDALAQMIMSRNLNEFSKGGG